MKAIQKKFYSKTSVLQMAVFVLIASCQKDDSLLSSTDVQNVNIEAASSAFISENLDLTTKIMAGITTAQYAGARTETDTLSSISSVDNRLSCALVTINRTGTKDAPAGTITIDYGASGASCAGVQRQGKIVITYNGQRWVQGSTFTIQLVNYFRNGAHIEGTENVTNSSKPGTDTLQRQFVSYLQGGKITFSNGTYIERQDSCVRVWYRFISPETNLLAPSADEWHLTGLAGGAQNITNKFGDTYTEQINEPLINKFSCTTSGTLIPVKGNMTVTVNNKNYVIDYGNGTCDNLITVSCNGGEKTISVSNDGN